MITSMYFSESEFQRCTPKCSLQDMSQSLMIKLDAVRALSGLPIILNSAYRSDSYEKSKGRSGTSEHTFGQAVDIACTSDSVRFRIVEAAIRVGFERIGIYKTFLHLGVSKLHSEGVIWLG
jgi:uncharacterized protein YcbK (DUF882 family)